MTEPYYADDRVTVHHGDSLDVLRALPDCSVDACVTDPPYGLSSLPPAAIAGALGAWFAGNIEQVPDARGFMGRAWDAFVPPPALWTECLRTLKPGGHLLAFAGSRTADLMGLSIRLAGFEIRDSITWIQAAGFPKSLDVSKAIDRRRDDRAATVAVTGRLADLAESAGVSRADVDAHMGTADMGGWWLSRLPHRCAVPTWEQWERLRALLDVGGELDAEVWRLNGRKGVPGEAWSQRQVVGERITGIGTGRGSVAFIGDGTRELTAPASAEAARWQGWGTALKPASEPIVVARKPLAGTVTETVLVHGTGALHIDACRTEAGQEYRAKCASVVGLASNRNGDAYGEWTGVREDSSHPAGRWPTNVVLSHAAHPFTGADLCASRCVSGCPVGDLPDDSGRYFPTFRYQAKADATERPEVSGVAWPTVKPLALMEWLVRLVTQPGGVVLEPFAGSGTTVEAAIRQGFRCLAVERDETALPLIAERIRRASRPWEDPAPGVEPRTVGSRPIGAEQPSLFADGAAS